MKAIMSRGPILFTGAEVFTPEQALTDASVLVIDGRVEAVAPEIAQTPSGTQVMNLHGLRLTPGLIDLHVQGLCGHDMWDENPDAMRAMSSDMTRFGVTSFLCTSSFYPGARFDAIMTMLEDTSLHVGARPRGLYLESPFVSEVKRGGIPAERITPPSRALLDKIIKISHGKLRIMTVAPELPGILDVIEGLKRNGVTAAIGHTNATFDETTRAIDAGASHATHLFNAMSPINHREPGAPSALLLDDRVTVELILDGIHIHPALIDMTVRLKGTQGAAIVTDAIKAAGLADGDYLFGDGVRQVKVRNGAPRLADGRLAGSSLTMNRAVRNMVEMVGRSPVEALTMATLTPAGVLGLERSLGRVAPGYDADLVVFDEDWSVRATMISGEFVFNELPECR